MVIIIFQTIMMYNREKEHVGNHLKEKGAVFIKSFETDVKAGMLSNQAALQRLVEKTASHPDITYLFLVDVSGKILAWDQRFNSQPFSGIFSHPISRVVIQPLIF
ncbi:hypothetical protein [Desulfotignum phosphitoxidans]|nr:hypothetical protein [Desulfotignum phosphitoxidans]